MNALPPKPYGGQLRFDVCVDQTQIWEAFSCHLTITCSCGCRLPEIPAIIDTPDRQPLTLKCGNCDRDVSGNAEEVVATAFCSTWNQCRRVASLN